MADKKYNFIDLFAGCGGLSEGFIQSGNFNALAHVEWELPMVETLRKRLISHWGHSAKEAKQKVVHFDIQHTDELLEGNWNDELKLKYESSNDSNTVLKGIKDLIENNDIDMVIGGPPCQAYSIHGRASDPNSMSDDYRNFLFESFVEIVDKLQPKVFVFENVPGILTAKPGGNKITDRIYKAFKSIGYEILKPENLNQAVYNAVDYNVPQNRKRVIIIGVRKGGSFNINEFYDKLQVVKSNSNKKTIFDAIGNFPEIVPLDKPIKVNGKNISHKLPEPTLSQHYPRYNNSRDVSIFKEWVSNNLNNLSHKDKVAFYKKQTGKDTLYSKYRSLEWNKPSPTIVAHLYKDGLMFIHPDAKQARSITIREAATLMTFPLDYEFVGSNAYCYKMIGNAVPVEFAKAIGNAIYNVMINKE